MPKILVVDDETTIVDILKTYLKKGGFDVSVSHDGESALRRLQEELFDLLITDVRMPGMDGLSLLGKAKSIQSQLAVIVMTAYAEVDTAVEAMKNGAFDYITKPFKFDELMVTIERALSYEKVMAENQVLRKTLDTHYYFGTMVGESEAMLDIYRLIERVAKTNSTILIRGESGTGKELVAKAVHDCSPRAEGPFVTVNCTAMTETLLESELFGYMKGAFTGATANKKGLFEVADGGTIFLDEIGSIPSSMQMKLLRVLQEKELRRVGGTKNIPVNVRVLAATNEDLEGKIAAGSFREDLYYRLSVIPVVLPPLRERRKDIALLLNHFLARFKSENERSVSITEEAEKLLIAYDWPGNVRELENMINRLATLCDNECIGLDDLPPTVLASRPESADGSPPPDYTETKTVPLKTHIRNMEQNYIAKMIERCGGNKDLAAKKLGISIATLYRKYED